MFDQLKNEHCNANANRTREFEWELQILERTCQCGDTEMLMPGGTLDDTFTECREIDEQGRQRRRTA